VSSCKRKRHENSISIFGNAYENDLCRTSKRKVTPYSPSNGNLRTLEVLFLVYTLDQMHPMCKYMIDDFICKMAVRLSAKCSIVSSVWLAIKYYGARPYIPTAYDMSVATTIPETYILSAELNDLNKINWDVSKFTHA